MFLSLSNIESRVSKFIYLNRKLFLVYTYLCYLLDTSIRCFSCKFEIIWFRNSPSQGAFNCICLKKFRKVLRKYPQWNPILVKFGAIITELCFKKHCVGYFFSTFPNIQKTYYVNTRRESHSFVCLFDSFDAIGPYVLIKNNTCESVFNYITTNRHAITISHPEVLYTNVALKNFAKFIVKHLYLSLSLKWLQTFLQNTSRRQFLFNKIKIFQSLRYKQ